MSSRENNLAERLGVDLADGKFLPIKNLPILTSTTVLVAAALHEIADKLGDRVSRAERPPNLVGSRSGYYTDSDARCVSHSFISSHY